MSCLGAGSVLFLDVCRYTQTNTLCMDTFGVGMNPVCCMNSSISYPKGQNGTYTRKVHASHKS